MTITLSTSNTRVRKLTTKDEDFCIVSGYAYYPRAMITISEDCPQQFRSMITTAMSRGWITADAWIKDSEYMWEKLNDNAS
jgi:hypothetical protein